MKYIGFLLVGDLKYGLRKMIDFNGQVFYVGILGFDYFCIGEYVEFEVLFLEDMVELIENLRKND